MKKITVIYLIIINVVFGEQFTIITKNEKFGLLNSKNELILPIEYDGINVKTDGYLHLLKICAEPYITTSIRNGITYTESGTKETRIHTYMNSEKEIFTYDEFQNNQMYNSRNKPKISLNFGTLIKENEVSALYKLLDNGAYFESITWNETLDQLLIMTLEKSNHSVLCELLKYIPDINRKINGKDTPLTYAKKVNSRSYCISRIKEKEPEEDKKKWEIGVDNTFMFSKTSEKYEFSHFFAWSDHAVVSYGINLNDKTNVGLYLGYGFIFGNAKIGINSSSQAVLGLDLNIPVVPFVNAGFKLNADYIFDKNRVESIYSIGYMVVLFE